MKTKNIKGLALTLALAFVLSMVLPLISVSANEIETNDMEYSINELRRYLTGQIQMSDEMLVQYDQNNDGDVNVLDLLILRRNFESQRILDQEQEQASEEQETISEEQEPAVKEQESII